MVRTFFAPPPPPPMPQPIDLDTGPPGGIHLAEPADVSWQFETVQGDLAIFGRGQNYRSRFYFERHHSVNEYGDTRRAGVWFGGEDRYDQRGMEWSHYFTNLVTDDFGTLVSSDTGVAP